VILPSRGLGQQATRPKKWDTPLPRLRVYVVRPVLLGFGAQPLPVPQLARIPAKTRKSRPGSASQAPSRPRGGICHQHFPGWSVGIGSTARSGGVTAGGRWTTGRSGEYGEAIAGSDGPTGSRHPTDPEPPLGRRCVSLEPDPLLPDEEAESIRAAQTGDRAAFARLVERYWDRLYRWLYHLTRDRYTAEDLTQETFLKALAAIRSFRPGSNFRAWLFRIGHNNFVNQKRSDRRTKHPLPEDMAGPETGGPEVAAENREAIEAINKAIANLPADFRAALMLRVVEGLSFREVAKVLGTTEETARWRVFKARQKLLKVLPPEILPPGLSEEEK